MTKNSEEILETLGDFTNKENWDRFFSLRGADDSFEWYAEWPALRDPLLSHLSSIPSAVSTTAAAAVAGESLQILVPGCGSSRLSEYLYDSGFRNITNIDFSKVAVSEMLRRYVRSRPEMRWRVMDMTDMQFAEESFDAILDKGGLDALMEPTLGSKLGSKYLIEVKRVLKSGGKYLCVTLAETHVIEFLFSEFRFGWETSIHAISQKPSKDAVFQTFMVAMVKEKSCALKPIVLSFDHSALNCSQEQVHALVSRVENENTIRTEYFSGSNIIYSMEDLKLGVRGNILELDPGRRCQLVLGEKGDSVYTYKAVLLDARQQPDSFLYHCGVFIVPKSRAHEWLFTSEEGQWLVVESSKAARLIMVLLDSRHSHASMDYIQKDLSPVVKHLEPERNDDGAKIPFMMASDGVKQRNIVRQVSSMTTGPIIIEDVIYENGDAENTSLTLSENQVFRRLIFERSLGLVQSEALLTREPNRNLDEEERRKNDSSSKSRKKGGQKRKVKKNLKVDHSCLASSYHSGIISGFALIVSDLENVVASQKQVQTIIIGLGAGLLPMFLHRCLPFLNIEVVELDPVILDLARDYFGFMDNAQLKVHIGDGIKFIENANSERTSASAIKWEKDNSDANLQASNVKITNCISNDSTGLRILIVDADSSDLSSGLTCPHAGFVEESFLSSVKEFLAKGGLFIINLVSRSPAIREMVVSRIKGAFNHLFSLELEEDVNEVLFACTMEECSEAIQLSSAISQLRSLLRVPLPEAQLDVQKMKCLK